MNTLSKVVLASVVSFSMGAAVTAFIKNVEYEIKYSNDRSSLLLASALASSMNFVYAVENDQVNERMKSIDGSLCWLSRMVKDQADHGFETWSYDYFVGPARQRIQMLIERESPATMPAYDNLLPCADPPRNADSPSPDMPTESLAKR